MLSGGSRVRNLKPIPPVIFSNPNRSRLSINEREGNTLRSELETDQ
jgi:hypothetical protein